MIDELKYEEVTQKIAKNWKNFKNRGIWRKGDTKIKAEKEDVAVKGEIKRKGDTKKSIFACKIWAHLDNFFFHSFLGETKGKMLENQCRVLASFQNFSFVPPLETMKKKLS